MAAVEGVEGGERKEEDEEEVEVGQRAPRASPLPGAVLGEGTRCCRLPVGPASP